MKLYNIVVVSMIMRLCVRHDILMNWLGLIHALTLHYFMDDIHYNYIYLMMLSKICHYYSIPFPFCYNLISIYDCITYNLTHQYYNKICTTTDLQKN